MTDLILPTDEQMERACDLIAKGVHRVWPEDMDYHEQTVWRASCRSTLVILLNQDKILGNMVQATDIRVAGAVRSPDGLTPFCTLPEEYGAIRRMRVLGDGLLVAASNGDCLLVSPEGKIILADADAGMREWYHHKEISYSQLVRDGKLPDAFEMHSALDIPDAMPALREITKRQRALEAKWAIQDAKESRVMIHNLTQKLWSAIQRPSPVISEEEVAAILREGLDVPTADETPHEGTISADGLSWTRKGAEALYGDDARPENPHWSHGAVRVETDEGPMIAITNPSYAEYLAVHNPELLRKSGERNVVVSDFPVT